MSHACWPRFSKAQPSVLESLSHPQPKRSQMNNKMSKLLPHEKTCVVCVAPFDGVFTVNVFSKA